MILPGATTSLCSNSLSYFYVGDYDLVYDLF